jgi:hypothetical protein
VLLFSFQDLRAVAIIQGRLSGKGGRMSGKRPLIQFLPVAPVPITRVLYSRAPRTHFTATTDITNEVITSLPISTAPQHPMCLEWTRHCLAVRGSSNDFASVIRARRRISPSTVALKRRSSPAAPLQFQKACECGARTKSGKPCRSPVTKKGRYWLHGGARGSGGPPGERNGHRGERTKGAIAERQKFSALLKMLHAGLM